MSYVSRSLHAPLMSRTAVVEIHSASIDSSIFMGLFSTVAPSLEPGPTLVDMVTTGFAGKSYRHHIISTRVGPGSRLRGTVIEGEISWRWWNFDYCSKAHTQVVMGGKMKKKTRRKTDALYFAVFRKKMAIEWQKSVQKEPGNCQKALPSLPHQYCNQWTKLKKFLNAT